MNFSDFIIYIYFTMAVYTFLQFCLHNITFTLHNNKIDEEVEIPNVFYGVMVALFSVAWPLTYYYIIRDMKGE